jgi:tetratricopeptide (TPR) repeat protein
MSSLSAYSCQFYHDTTAHFNAHFLADEKMNEIEEKIFIAYKDNFNEVLNVLPPLDTTATAMYKADLEYCIKKASIPIQYHKQSKWTDDCYIIVGKARMYAGDFANAMNTFKYVNTESNDFNARHQALILLMRMFIEQNDKKSVVYVANYMAKEPEISDKNARDFYLNMAQFYRSQNNFSKTVEYLEKALPLVNNRKMKTKCYFVAAQAYQQLGNNEKSFECYNEALKRNPPYEMTFNAQLNASRATTMNDPDAVAKSERYLRNLLSDDKNVEYWDKVYYELGSFEARRKSTQPAINYLRESLIANKNATPQRIATYLKLGEVYTQLKQDYPKAVNYYDSAFVLMNENSSNYAKIKKQIEVLKSFTNSYLSVKDADRLLKLASMTEKEQSNFIDREIKTEIEEIENERRFYARSQEKISGQRATTIATPSLIANNPNEKKWYFYNPVVKESGEQNFFRVWGNRTLEDNWRRSQRQSIPSNNTNQTTANQIGNKTDSTNTSPSNQTEVTRESNLGIRNKKDRLLEIPTTSEKIEVIKNQLETGLFDLAKMYALTKDLPKAQDTYLRIVNEFPQGKYAAEALYAVVRICKEIKDCDSEKYNQMLKEKYPTSNFAHSLDNKNIFKEAKAADSVVNRKYEETYKLYQTEKYQEALTSLQGIENAHPDSHLADKLELLKAMVMIRTSNNLPEVQKMIENFIIKHKDTDLEPLAQSLLENIKKKITGGN